MQYHLSLTNAQDQRRLLLKTTKSLLNIYWFLLFFFYVLHLSCRICPNGPFSSRVRSPAAEDLCCVWSRVLFPNFKLWQNCPHMSMAHKGKQMFRRKLPWTYSSSVDVHFQNQPQMLKVVFKTEIWDQYPSDYHL